MRTTLTLDDDVAARLRQLQGFSSFKEAVNSVLRIGLEQLDCSVSTSPSPYKMQSVTLGAKIKNLDNIAEILDLAEADLHVLGRC